MSDSLYFSGFPGGSDGKESACNARDLGLTPGLGRFPGEENGYSLQYICVENPLDKGTWWATVHGVTVHVAWWATVQESDRTERLTLSLSLHLHLLLPTPLLPLPVLSPTGNH